MNSALLRVTLDKGPKTPYKRPKGTEKSLWAFPTRQTQPERKNIKLAFFPKKKT